jgi:cytochrome b subunit of formate dehydrogenase
MFRLISLLGFIGLTAVIVWAIRSQLVQLAVTQQRLREQTVDLTNNLRQWRSLSTPAQLATLMRFFYLATLLSVFILALTGFLPVIVFGQPISNIPLMLHLVLAPFFAIGITALALLWSQRHRFTKNDWEPLRQRRLKKHAGTETDPDVWQKICFWLSVLLAVPVIVSTIFMMYPLYGTAGQEWLLHLHGYAGLLLLAVAVVHTYLILRPKHD